MASVGDISINVNLTIPEETVERCLDILSMYITDNPGADIITDEFPGYDKITRKVRLKWRTNIVKEAE